MSGGRPEKYTPEEVAEALRASSGLISVAARRLDCAPITIRHYLGRYDVVKEAIDEARTKLVDLAEAKLKEAVAKGESWAVSLTLRTLGKDRGYVEGRHVSGTIEHEIHPAPRLREVIIQLPALTDAADDAGTDQADDDVPVLPFGDFRVLDD